MLRNFEHTGKVRGYHTKYWKNQGIFEKMLFAIFLSDIQMNCVLFAEMENIFSFEKKH